MMLDIKMPREIKTNFKGFEFLVNLQNYSSYKHNENINFNFEDTKWFDANLLTLFACSTETLINNQCHVSMNNIFYGLQNIMCKNGFSKYWNETKLPAQEDINNTTIRFAKLENGDIHQLADIIPRELLGKPDMPYLSKKLKKEFTQVFLEIFLNCFQHGNSEHAFICGQYYPNSPNKRLDFSIANLGRTIKSNVDDFYGMKALPDSYKNCIDWAMQNGTTTKEDGTGGIGLYLLTEFARINKGQIYICSDNEYWKQSNIGLSGSREFSKALHGTIVNVEFNLTDCNRYCLASENN